MTAAQLCVILATVYIAPSMPTWFRQSSAAIFAIVAIFDIASRHI